MSLWSHSKAALSLLLITLNLVFWCIPLLALSLVKLVLPGKHNWLNPILESIYRAAARINDAWLQGVMGLQWDSPTLDLPRDKNVVVLSNHVSWADVLVIQSIVVRSGSILKFLAKRELIFVPIFGVIFWAFDFPVLRRRTRAGANDAERRRHDLEAVEEAGRSLLSRPAVLVNFVEGTRFSEEKRERQSAGYAHLLAPRVGGLSALMDDLGGKDLRIIDLTLKYPRRHSFWRFLAGKSNRISIHTKVFEAAELPGTRATREVWLRERWKIKDRRIDAFRREAPFP